MENLCIGWISIIFFVFFLMKFKGHHHSPLWGKIINISNSHGDILILFTQQFEKEISNLKSKNLRLENQSHYPKSFSSHPSSKIRNKIFNFFLKIMAFHFCGNEEFWGGFGRLAAPISELAQL